MIFADRLTILRNRKGLRQRDVAAMIGVAQTDYSRWECDKRKPNLTNVVKLCKVLNCSADELLGIKDVS